MGIMMKRLLSVIIGAVVLISCLFIFFFRIGAFGSGEPIGAPSSSSYDAGVISDSVPNAEHTFHLENRGRSPLVIQTVKRDCICTSATLSSTRIRRGETAAIQIQVENAGNPGWHSGGITLATNSEQTPTISYSIRFFRLEGPRITPERIHDTEVDKGGRLSREVVVYDTALARSGLIPVPQPGRVPPGTQVEYISSTYRETPLVIYQDEPSNCTAAHVEHRFRIRAESIFAPIQGTVELSSGEKHLLLPIDIRPRTLRASPNTVFAAGPVGSLKDMTQEVRIASDAPEEIRITNPIEWLSIERKEREKGCYKVSFQGPLDPGVHKGYFLAQKGQEDALKIDVVLVLEQ